MIDHFKAVELAAKITALREHRSDMIEAQRVIDDELFEARLEYAKFQYGADFGAVVRSDGVLYKINSIGMSGDRLIPEIQGFRASDRGGGWTKKAHRISWPWTLVSDSESEQESES